MGETGRFAPPHIDPKLEYTCIYCYPLPARCPRGFLRFMTGRGYVQCGVVMHYHAYQSRISIIILKVKYWSLILKLQQEQNKVFIIDSTGWRQDLVAPSRNKSSVTNVNCLSQYFKLEVTHIAFSFVWKPSRVIIWRRSGVGIISTKTTRFSRMSVNWKELGKESP